METTSPRDAVIFLQELAQLSLCKDYHQGRSSTLIHGWTTVMDDAQRKYNSEEFLKTRVLLLERELREKTVAQEACSGQQNAIVQNRLQHLEEYEKWKLALQSSSELEEELRRCLSESSVEFSRLDALLTQERTTVSQQIFAERDRLAQYRNKVEADFANRDKAITDLRSKLDEEYQRSDGLSESLDKQDAIESSLRAEINTLEEKLAKEHVKLDHQTKEAGHILLDTRGILRELESVQKRLSISQEQSQKLRDELEDAKLDKLHSCKTSRRHNHSLWLSETTVRSYARNWRPRKKISPFHNILGNNQNPKPKNYIV
jgi:chromosome segregation ATPase